MNSEQNSKSAEPQMPRSDICALQRGPSNYRELAAANIERFVGVGNIPIGLAGPVIVHGEHAQGECSIPLAATEGTLVAFSVHRYLISDQSLMRKPSRSRLTQTGNGWHPSCPLGASFRSQPAVWSRQPTSRHAVPARQHSYAKLHCPSQG